MIQNDLADSISLAGIWEFSLGQGSAYGALEVPGCWEAQGYSKTTDGPAHFRRKIQFPASWEGSRILGEFQAVSYACEITLNGEQVGEHRGMWTPFTVDLTASARPGEENTLELVVFKPGERFPMRSTLAGFLPDVATTFGGIWQPVTLRALKAGVENVQVETDSNSGGLHISGQAKIFDGALTERSWQIVVYSEQEAAGSLSLPYENNGKLNAHLDISDPILWSPENPALYRVQVTLLENGSPAAQVSQRVGFRRLTAEGDQLLFNDQPFMVRGILSWGWEPDLIAPSYTAELAREEMRRVRKLGFNLIKLCLFVPNQTYYDIADEEGMLLWQEWPLWLPQITPDLREIIGDEYAAMTRLTRHHPSVILYTLGCELNRSADGDLLRELNEVVRGSVSEVLICDNSGSGESYGGLDTDSSDFISYHPYCDINYFEPLLDNWRRGWKSPRPWIFGEFCDSDTFRDIDEIIDHAGGQRPWWMTTDNPITQWRPESLAMLEEKERLEQARPGFSPQEMVRASYAQSLVERKYTLESLRRRAGMGGYVVTGLRDTPISTSGVWDDLYRPKWEADDFLKFNDDAVLTLDVPRRRRWHNGGDRPDHLDHFNHFSESDVSWSVILNLSGKDLAGESRLSWSLVDAQGRELQQGIQEITGGLLSGAPREIGTVRCKLPSVETGTEARLNVSLLHNGSTISNEWGIWIYPKPPHPPTDIGLYDPGNILEDYGDWLGEAISIQTADDYSKFQIILATALNEDLLKTIKNGGRVLLIQQGNGPLPSRRCPFWRESIVLFPDHPLWELFPHGGYADMQFFGLASDVAFDSSKLTGFFPDLKAYRPILRRLDAREFHMSDYLFEAEIGKGLLVGCSLKIQGGRGAQPYGWRRNTAGSALLWMLIDRMRKA